MANNNTRYFQWVISERKGDICILDKIVSEDENIFITFTDKSRINENLVAPLNSKDLTGKLMAEIDSPNNRWNFKEEWVGRQEEVWELNAAGERVCVQPLVEGRKVTKLIPPKPSPKSSSNFGVIVQPQVQAVIPTQEIKEEKNKIDITDPVYILMNQSKKIDTEISMNIIISLPSKNLYNIAKESFNDAEEKFVGYIIENIDDNKIKEALRSAITEMYENTDN